ncbi:NADPH:quinone reductase-like protein [Hesseltinella vesiculosa]|uniref:NADPH:quinone reductase-like protein n=1 Tax=Hesseltinella vesiculosa TaxID=101127 RepID=A0A1X2GRZ7_9FUNG|nr:NADPH:quinone reductase-like protein [Hesseltinella vesiculosa]
MRAVLVQQPGDASQLYIGETATPEPKELEVLVKIHSFCLNRMDIVQRRGFYPPPPGASSILGVEMSGTVEKVGSSVTKFKQGDSIFGLMGGGAYAEYAVIHQDLAMHKPDELSFEQAAAIPETWFTAYQALFSVAHFTQGESVLIHAGASGVGVAAIQLAKQNGAKHIFATVSSDEKVKFCESVGATRAINYKTQDWAQVVADVTRGAGVNVIIDPVGKDYFVKDLNNMAVDARLVILAFMSGATVEKVPLDVILRKRLQILGSTLRSRPLNYQIELCKAVYENVIQHGFAQGTYKVFIDKEFDWNDISAAHLFLESNQSMGKIVVHVTQ